MAASLIAIAPGSWIARLRQRAFRSAPGDHAPVALGHSRIYILPTRRGALFIGTTLAMLLTSLNYGLSLGFLATFLMAGLLGSALLHTFRNLVGVEVAPLSAADDFVGGRLAFSLALAAHGTARGAIRLQPRGGLGVVQELPAEGRFPVTLEVEATRRGRIALGRLTLSTDFPLGLWHAWAYVHFPLSGIAYPAPEVDAPRLPVATSGTEAGAAGRNEDADLAGLREYQPGDPLQRVAWKAVARGGGWFTKAFEGSGGGGPLTLEWSALPAALGTEARLSRLCAWVLACERAARPCGLRIPGVALPAVQSREHRRALLTALALFEAGAS